MNYLILELVYQNRIPQHEKSNKRITKELHMKNRKQKTLQEFSLQN